MEALAAAADAEEEGTPACPDPAPALQVGGLVPFSTLDYPGKLAAVVFCQGCAWQCGYCHNPHLRTPTPRAGSPHAWGEIVRWLDRRQGLLDAVVFSGGEPTTQPGLRAAIADVRRRGFAVGLHSAGLAPRRLLAVLPSLDWIGLDIKATPGRYDAVTGARGSARAAYASLRLVLAAGLPYELRTTLYPGLTTAAELRALAGLLADYGARRWVIQRFRATGCADAALAAVGEDPLDDRLADELSSVVSDFSVR